MKKVHISTIRCGDTILHEGKIKTVCEKDIKRGFCGITIFGDSYIDGLKPVIKCDITDINNNLKVCSVCDGSGATHQKLKNHGTENIDEHYATCPQPFCENGIINLNEYYDSWKI